MVWRWCSKHNDDLLPAPHAVVREAATMDDDDDDDDGKKMDGRSNTDDLRCIMMKGGEGIRRRWIEIDCIYWIVVVLLVAPVPMHRQ